MVVLFLKNTFRASPIHLDIETNDVFANPEGFETEPRQSNKIDFQTLL